MTPVNRIKRSLGLVLATGLVAVTGLVLAALTTVVISFGTGANPGDAFTPAAEPVGAHTDSVSWNSEEVGLLRSVERRTRQDVARAWVGAIAGEADASWFAGGALERREEHARLGSRLDASWTYHEITTYFYSLDGQVLGLDVESYGTVDIGDGGSVPLNERYEVVMILRDWNWRVERLTRL